jgi:hypothetical protein
VSKSDLAGFVTAAIDAPRELSFATFYGVSANTWRLWDLTESVSAVGYRARDNAESWRQLL